MQPETQAFQKLLELVTVLSVVTSSGLVVFIIREVIHWVFSRKHSPPHEVAVVTANATEYKTLIQKLVDSTSMLNTSMATMLTKQEDHFKITEQIRSGVEEINTNVELNRSTLDSVVTPQLREIKGAIDDHDKSRRRRR